MPQLWLAYGALVLPHVMQRMFIKEVGPQSQQSTQ
jgi:hypothetical protein